MRAFLLLVSAVTSVFAVSSSTKHVLHERRSSVPDEWQRLEGALPTGHKLPMRIALVQSNLDKMEEYLMEVSDPSSIKFGRHWSQREIAEVFAPSAKTHGAVRAWLESAGVPPERQRVPESKGWIHFDATIGEAERLFKTKYHLYKHKGSGQPHIGCDEYHVPDHVSKHIDFVTPSVHFDTRIVPPSEERERKRGISRRGIASDVGMPGSGSLPKPGRTFPEGTNMTTMRCSDAITPRCLRELYQMPRLRRSIQRHGYGIVEYSPQAYVPSDLVEFFAMFNPDQQQKAPTLASIDGGFAQQNNMSFAFNGESDLDLEFGMALVDPVPVTLYQVGDPYLSGSFNNFLDAIDGSYCTSEGGDDPTQDSVYPDTDFRGQAGAYEGTNNCGTYSPTSVISTSYAYNEADLTPSYEIRQCNEYAKLGLAGTTVLYSSGDYGVAGNRGRCIDPATGRYNNGSSGIFNPSFPGTCPYITAVGATQIAPNASVTAPETACETVIYSGGGFSNVFPIPSYQKAAVAGYYAKHAPPYGVDRYNNSRAVRAFPDVSANGAKYMCIVDGRPRLVYGTSASSPTFGAVITIVNEYRAQAGRRPVGFLNPALYANPEVLHDITSGGNRGCGTPGFTAVPGWDPVTGLGTPNTIALIALFMTLP